MSSSAKPTGNPVFDFKAGFRATAQSAQRILLYNGILITIIGLSGRFFTLKSHAMRVTLHWAPLLGFASIVISFLFGLWWRTKLRSDFRREFSANWKNSV